MYLHIQDIQVMKEHKLIPAFMCIFEEHIPVVIIVTMSYAALQKSMNCVMLIIP